MKWWRSLFAAAAAPPAGAADHEAELALSRARVGELEARLAASEAERGELQARLAAGPAPTGHPKGGNGKIVVRLAAADAAASELRAANEALARENAALKKEHETALFDWRPRDFAAELPAGVLLNIMDHAPDGRCADSFMQGLTPAFFAFQNKLMCT